MPDIQYVSVEPLIVSSILAKDACGGCYFQRNVYDTWEAAFASSRIGHAVAEVEVTKRFSLVGVNYIAFVYLRILGAPPPLPARQISRMHLLLEGCE